MERVLLGVVGTFARGVDVLVPKAEMGVSDGVVFPPIDFFAICLDCGLFELDFISAAL